MLASLALLLGKLLPFGFGRVARSKRWFMPAGNLGMALIILLTAISIRRHQREEVREKKRLDRSEREVIVPSSDRPVPRRSHGRIRPDDILGPLSLASPCSVHQGHKQS